MSEPNQYHNLDDVALAETILALEAEADAADKAVKRAKNELLERKAQEIKVALMQKDEPFGSVSQDIGDFKIGFNTPKKVEWNQDGLAKLYAQISADPDEDVREYIKLEYKVSENGYKAWPSGIKSAFEPYRTVKAGSVAVKIERKE